MPRSRSSRSIAAPLHTPLDANFGQLKGHQQVYESNNARRFDFPQRARGKTRRNFKSATLAPFPNTWGYGGKAAPPRLTTIADCCAAKKRVPPDASPPCGA